MVTFDVVDTYNKLQELFDTTSAGIRGCLYWGNKKGGALPRSSALGFQRYLSSVISGSSKDSVGLKAGLKRLNSKYLKWKKVMGYDLNKWVATGKLSDSIIVTDKGGNSVTVEVDPSAVSATYPIKSEKLTDVVRWIEEGRDGSDAVYPIPERPLWALTVEMFKAGKLPRFDKAVEYSIERYAKSSVKSKLKSSMSAVAGADVSSDFSVVSLEKALEGNFGSDIKEKEMVDYAINKGFS